MMHVTAMGLGLALLNPGLPLGPNSGRARSEQSEQPSLIMRLKALLGRAQEKSSPPEAHMPFLTYHSERNRREQPSSFLHVLLHEHSTRWYTGRAQDTRSAPPRLPLIGTYAELGLTPQSRVHP
jgi:hypothetical protein